MHELLCVYFGASGPMREALVRVLEQTPVRASLQSKKTVLVWTFGSLTRAQMMMARLREVRVAALRLRPPATSEGWRTLSARILSPPPDLDEEEPRSLA
jgi:hypothetical protein